MVALLLEHQEQVKERMTASAERTTAAPLREMCLHHLSCGGGVSGAAWQTRMVSDGIQNRMPVRNSHAALVEKLGVDQALNSGLSISGCARLSLIELTGSHLPEGMGPRLLAIAEKSALRLCQGQY